MYNTLTTFYKKLIMILMFLGNRRNWWLLGSCIPFDIRRRRPRSVCTTIGRTDKTTWQRNWEAVQLSLSGNRNKYYYRLVLIVQNSLHYTSFCESLRPHSHGIKNCLCALEYNLQSIWCDCVTNIHTKLYLYNFS